MARRLSTSSLFPYTTLFRSMGVPSDGSYGIPEGTMFGFPVTTENGEYKIVQGLEIDAFSQERINVTLNELLEEREGVKHLVGDRKSTRLNSSHTVISYAVFC